MFARMFRMGWQAGEAFPVVKRSIIRSWYQLVSRLDRDGDLRFMNFGYDSVNENDDTPVLREKDCGDRYQIQLYHRVASGIPLAGRDVLEVGCGRGGGADFIARCHHPRSYTALDLSSRAIAFSRKNYVVEGLSFVCGDAEALGFPDESFDAVVNVESSSHYPHFDRFLNQVGRVLRPGGHFLWADIRTSEEMIGVRRAFANAGLAIVRAESITPNVVCAIDLDDDRKRRLLYKYIPPVIQSAFMEFGGMKGTDIYRKFKTHAWDYWCMTLQKSDAS